MDFGPVNHLLIWPPAGATARATSVPVGLNWRAIENPRVGRFRVPRASLCRNATMAVARVSLVSLDSALRDEFY